MINPTKHIVQFVGFKANLNEIDFLKRWLPFALGFKKAGITSIDLYKVSNNDHLNFISRNLWDTNTYFQNFPSGIAVSGRGGGVAVTQFGGYWIAENELDKPDEMQILFTNEKLPSTIRSRKRCSVNVIFENQVEFTEEDFNLLNINPLNILSCTHLKTM